MAQTEDTELQDLVVEALEKNGSLAKVRALLRANVFLAFEDECENRKHNINLDKVLKLPEGILALSVIHEFLEFCCLKNTLFVYMSESRQGQEYNYEGKKSLADRLNCKNEVLKEPILLSLIKMFMNPHLRKICDLSSSNKTYNKNSIEEQNCTYILHDSQSSTTSNSNSDNSSDEKNKIHLRLQLDHSDTDTSSDSVRDKSSSEYIPGAHILKLNNNNNDLNKFITNKSIDQSDAKIQSNNLTPHEKTGMSIISNDIKLTNSSSDSTSYIELKPFNALDAKMLNTAGLPNAQVNFKDTVNLHMHSVTNPSKQSTSGILSSLAPVCVNKDNVNNLDSNEKKLEGLTKSDAETSDFSYRDDFSTSPVAKLKEITENIDNNSKLDLDESEKLSNKNSPDSPHQISESSQSSVSISDVADLISEKSSSNSRHAKSKHLPSNHSKEKVEIKSSKLYSDDSGDFTESPVPSLSNLSLDIHSD